MNRGEFEVYKLRYDRAEKYLPETDDMTLITLKGHLLVEEVLEDIVLQYCREPEVLSKIRITFFLKLRLAQALVGSDQVPELLWKLAEALNSLRNELSHQLDSPKVEKKFDEVIKLYEEVQKLDPEMSRLAKLRVAIGFMLGAL